MSGGTGFAAFRAFVEEVRGRTDLVEVVGRDVALRRVGHVLKGLSPFHAEKHPSFVVWQATQTWRDYSNGGGSGGDVFAYVQEREKVSFKEAVLLLAERTGVKPPHQDEEVWKRALALRTERQNVEQLLTMAATYYHQHTPAQIRDKYFKRHYGFDDKTVADLQLGWADGHLFEHLTKAGVSRRAALATGLFVPFDTGRVVDFFHNRLVFPYWRGGRVVYFTARKTEHTSNDKWEEAKYKKLRTHSPERNYISSTVRNDYLFNEDAVRDAEEVVITEGPADCISAMQAGFACISPGTSSVRGQDMPRLLKLTRGARRIVICNDSEKSGAGEAGAKTTAEVLWSLGSEVCIATIPRPDGVDKIDLNELVTSQGPEALREVIAAAKAYPEYLLDSIPKDAPRADLERLLAPVLTALAQCSSIRADVLLDAITAKFGVRRRALTHAAKKLAPPKRPSPPSPSQRRVLVPLGSSSLVPQASSSAAPGGAAPGGAAPGGAPSGAGPVKLRPTIRVNDRQLRDVVADGWRALHADNAGPQFFLRAGRLVRLTEQDGVPSIAVLSEAELYGFASNIADWERSGSKGVRAVVPMRETVRDMLVRPDPALPPLEAVVSAPFFDSDGTLVSTPGYHQNARTWYRTDGLQVEPLPAQPTDDEIAAARALLVDELLCDFPFTAQSDRAQAVAALLLPFVRRLIPDCTPIHLLEAPSPGSGKGLLADMICMLILGSAATPTTITQDEDETRKKITSVLIKGSAVVLLDNVKGMLDSAQLAAAITSETWSDRILGESRIVELPNRATWIATANNPQLSLEIARRCVRVRLDAKVERPWLRSQFKHDPLKPWARAHRGELVRALLILVQAWLAAGRPPGRRVLGSFDSWARTVGGILDHAGIGGFLEDMNELYEAADGESQEWRALVNAWWARYGSLLVTTGELLALALENELLGSVLTGRDPHGQKIRLGRALVQMRDRQFATYRIALCKNNSIKVAQYRLVDTSSNDGAPPTGEQLSLAEPGNDGTSG